MVNGVNLTEPRLTSEIGLWAHLWGIILILVIEVERSAYNGCHHSLTGILGCVSGERKLSGCRHGLLLAARLLVGVT